MKSFWSHWVKPELTLARLQHAWLQVLQTYGLFLGMVTLALPEQTETFLIPQTFIPTLLIGVGLLVGASERQWLFQGDYEQGYLAWIKVHLPSYGGYFMGKWIASVIYINLPITLMFTLYLGATFDLPLVWGGGSLFIFLCLGTLAFWITLFHLLFIGAQRDDATFNQSFLLVLLIFPLMIPSFLVSLQGIFSLFSPVPWWSGWSMVCGLFVMTGVLCSYLSTWTIRHGTFT